MTAASRSPGWIALCVCAALVTAPPAAAVVEPAFGPLREVATLQPGGALLELANADFTGDGRQDVLVVRGRWASTDELPISILVDDGSGGFADRAPELFGGPVPRAVWPRQIVLADYNGDGRPDAFIGDSGMDTAPFPGHANHLLLSAPGGGYDDASANLPSEPLYFHSGAAGDVDADGDVDLFVANILQSPTPPLRVLLNDGAGRFTPVSGRIPDSLQAYPRWFTRSALVDVNGDGTLDLVLLGVNDNPSSTVLANDGNGYFTELPGALPAKPFGIGSIGVAIQSVNLNGDARPDLLLGYTRDNPYYVGRWIQLVVNNGDGSFRDETAVRLPQADNSLDWPYEIVIGDLNSDGATDFGIDVGANFCCASRRAVPPFYLNRGDGTFEPLAASAFAEPPYGQFRLFDVNRDGMLDLFGAWEAGASDAPEHYAKQLQGDSGAVTTTPPPAPADDDRDGVPNGTDRCPAAAGRAPSGCPRAVLTRAGRVRLGRAGERGLHLRTGIDARCPAAGTACPGTTTLDAARPGRQRGGRRSRLRRLQATRFRVRAGGTADVALTLNRRVVRALRAARKLKVRITVTCSGPDGSAITLVRSAVLRAPSRRAR